MLAGCSAPALDGATCEGGACLAPAVCMPGQASAQFRRQIAPPPVLRPRQRAAVSLTFANCSGQTWTRDQFALRPAHAAVLSTWGVPRIALPIDVPDGLEVTVPFEVAAPSSAGAYPFSWSVTHDGVEVFEEHSKAVVVSVLGVADCGKPGPPARFRAQVPPGAFVATGARVSASVTFANCGLDSWSRADGVVLGSRAAPDDTWGPRTIALPGDVPPLREVTIPVEVTAPRRPGSYVFAWQLARAGDWFGDPSPPVSSTVLDAVDCGAGGPPARFLSQSAPTVLVQDEDASVGARFGNCGDRIWDGGFSLDSALPGRERRWGAGPVPLPLPVGPGFAIDIPFQIRAPGSAGTFPYRFGIVTPEGALLDDPTPPLDVTVRCVPACGDHNCGGDGCGGSCGDCPGGWTCDGAHCQPPARGYRLPWACGQTILVTQGNNGDICGSNAGDHTGISAYAWDFALSRHTPVRASRGGTVTLSANVVAPGQGCYDGCSQPFGTSAFWQCCKSCLGISNRVNVDHGDGTVATYYHLDVATAAVGAHVNAGEVLGYSGTSGCSSGPHLHFLVMGNCPKGYCQSQSIAFDEAGKPACGQKITSQNCP